MLWCQGPLLCVPAGKALEKAGGKEFLETVKELRKSQGPLEVAEGKKDTAVSSGNSSFCMFFPPDILFCSRLLCALACVMQMFLFVLRSCCRYGQPVETKTRKSRILVCSALSVFWLLGDTTSYSGLMNSPEAIAACASPEIKENFCCHLCAVFPVPFVLHFIVTIRNGSQSNTWGVRTVVAYELFCFMLIWLTVSSKQLPYLEHK